MSLAATLARLRQRAAAPALFVPAGTPGTAGTFGNGAAFAVPAAGDVAGTPGTPDRPGRGAGDEVPGVPGQHLDAGTPETRQIRAWPRRPRRPRANDGAGAACPERSPERLSAPAWPNLDALRRAYGEARGVEAKRAVVAAWAVAAGGRVEGGVLLMPAETPKGTAATAAFLKTYARCVGLTVGELTCAWCPNPPGPGHHLCDACRWLAGDER